MSTHNAKGDQGNSTLASTIQNLISNINFTSDLDTSYMGLSLGTVTTQNFQSMIDALPSSSWSSILYWYAVVDKYNIANQTTIERALDAATMMSNGLPQETADIYGKPCFLVYDRYLFYGYNWANKYQYDLTKWNLTSAYISYDDAVKYCQGAPPLWIYGDNTAQTYSGRYYDETGESLDGYLEFYKFGITQALGRAEALWSFENSHYWDGVYYGYTDANGLYECEAGGFEQIIWKLYDYDPTIPNVQNLLTDINNRYLSNLWNSPQWFDYVIQHANSNPQRRLENTEMTWQSLIGTYPLLSTTAQTEVQELLNGTAYGIVNGNNQIMPAWSLLSNPSAGLYDPTTGLYRIHSDTGISNSATLLAANILMQMGITETSALLAVPLEEIHYEYTYNMIDKDLYAMDFNTNSIKIPLSTPGTLTFAYGSTPSSFNFDKNGVWNITFSSDWNTIISANYVGSLPTNRMYYPSSIQSPPPPLSYAFTEQGFELPVDVPVQQGVNNVQIYANYTLVYNSTFSITNSTSQVTCVVQTSNLAIGNYLISANVNNGTQNLENVAITYPGDLTGNFIVDFNDFFAFVNAYVNYYSSNGTQYNYLADFNHDGKIDYNDFFAFVNSYINYYNQPH